MISFLKALLAAIIAFFSSRRADAQAEHDQIVQETQEAVDAIPGKSDAELSDIAESLGLSAKDTGGAGNVGTGTAIYYDPAIRKAYGESEQS